MPHAARGKHTGVERNTSIPMPPRLPPAQRLRTYVIEDSPVIRENLIATLEELGPVRVVGVAEDEGTALDWLENATPGADLVIVDLFLKSGSGLGVLSAMRGRPHPERLVVLSNFATPDMRRKCLEEGADQVFDKSAEIDALIQYCIDLGAQRSLA
jgi:DNA-binding NarL/FixJ family response regulator